MKSLKNLMLSNLLIFLSITGTFINSMELEEPEKTFTQTLPIELWEKLIYYSQNIELLNELSRLTELSDPAYEKIIENYLSKNILLVYPTDAQIKSIIKKSFKTTHAETLSSLKFQKNIHDAFTRFFEKNTYVCDKCGKWFERLGTLKSHKIMHLIKPYVCDYRGCDAAFTYLSNLTAHKRIHSGEKPYVCDYRGCDKAFTHLSNLTAHKRLCLIEKPYVCDYNGCDKAFTHLSNLTAHKRTHTAEKPYVCPYPGCGQTFTQLNMLRTHTRTHHGY